MHVVVHVVRLGRLPQRFGNARFVHADIHRHGFAGVEEPVHVLIEKRPCAVIEAHALPDAVAQHETTVIDRDLGLVAVDDVAVDVDLDVAVADVFVSGVGRGVFGHAVVRL